MNLFRKHTEDENRKRLRGILEKVQHQDCPDGWEFQQFAVGGLTDVGFSQENPDLLLVISSNGRGLFDCSKLERIDRDYDDYFDIDYSNLTCYGIGKLKNEQIRIAGLHGGGLPTGNTYGESVETMALDWPQVDVIFQPKGKHVYSEKDTSACIRIGSPDTMKTYGFSPSGNVFVIATSSDLFIYRTTDAQRLSK